MLVCLIVLIFRIQYKGKDFCVRKIARGQDAGSISSKFVYMPPTIWASIAVALFFFLIIR